MSTEGSGRGTARFIWEHVKFNVASAMEYRQSFISQVLFMMANDFMLLFFWWVIYGRVEDISGWEFRDIITLYAVFATAFGLSASVFGNARRLARVISEGQLDYYLLLPRDPLLHVIVSRSDISGIGDVAFGVAVFALFTRVTLGRVILFAVVCLASCAIYTAFEAIVGSLAFFIGNAQALSSELTEALTVFSGYPGSMFRGAARAVLYTLLPAGFAAFIPVELLRRFSLPLFAGLVAFSIGIACLAAWVFRVGLTRYESGNLLSARM
ncbi:MAG: ABC-2 family transporter protein [Clostridia bacterium]|nr:ABC-2 family transporter protein [Clostridia bacterium]